ncbi:MAG: response regulator [Candidatus Pacebacteria bacterium]|nr:response regulator [Candidatus Paceibacterota bacterium]
MKILIVEDDDASSLIVKGLLEKYKYEVVSAVSGKEAVKKAEEDKPDLILMDIDLGEGMDGIEAAVLINSRFGIPVIYLTSLSNNESFERAKITEAFGYILKPVNNRELQCNIEMALYKHKAEKKLKQFNKELQDSLAKVKLLSGLIPVCANCKDIRNDEGYWEQIETYIKDHSEAEFSHGICPKCVKKLYPEISDKNEDTKKQQSND